MSLTAPGGIAALVMDFNGIAVDQYVKPSGEFDVETWAYSVVLKQVRQAAEDARRRGHPGGLHQTERMTVVRMLNSEYFATVALGPHGNAGRARFMLRVSSGDMAQALE
ncbi:MAG: hypothetical protein R3A78_05290 [Polyangiales bacterium]